VAKAKKGRARASKAKASAPAAPKRIVIAAGGALDTAMLPLRLLHLRADYGVELAAAVSTGALEFVTGTALTGVTGNWVYDPETRFEAGTSLPAHLALANPDLLVVYPATARIVAQCALGVVTCPVTRLFAFTPKDRIVIAPAIHPRMDRRLYDGHVARLREVGCEVIGGAEYWATWAEVEEACVRRLGLGRSLRAPGDVLLDELSRALRPVPIRLSRLRRSPSRPSP